MYMLSMGCAPSAIQGGMVHCKVNRHEDNLEDGRLCTPSSQGLSIANIKDSDGDTFGSRMKMRTHRMKVLLVFGREDLQSEAFVKGSDRGGYNCFFATSRESALGSFMEYQQDVVIVDCRQPRSFDCEGLCRSMRDTIPKCHSIFLAVTKKSSDKDEPSIVNLLNAGYNRKFNENMNAGTCYNELMSIERGELRAQQQLAACNAMLAALQNITESVEIIDKKLRTEFVNSAFEKQTGYSSADALGSELQEKLQVDNSNEEDRLVSHIRKGEIWEGNQSLRRKNGDTILCKSKVVPVESSPGKILRHVIIRLPVQESNHNLDYRNRDTNSKAHAGVMHYKRRESIAHIHSMTIEAPITKVINIISDAQASSPSNMNVVQALDKVLDILQTTELFAPHIQQVTEEDPLTNDLVGGLCDQTTISSNGRHSSTKHTTQKTSLSLRLKSIQPPAPDIQEAMINDASWDFDIIKLERLSCKRVLVPLGVKILRRFGACDFLGVDESTLANWLQLIGDNYHSTNTYHNATHAADVLQATAYFLDKMRPKKILDTSDELAVLIAAVIHDVDHPGKTSSFLVNSRDKLALLYNDIAVLENHHAALGFSLTTSDEDANIFKNLDSGEYDAMRHNIIDMVLATEMAKHFEHLQRFLHICKAHMKNQGEDISIKSSMTSMSDLVITSSENKRQILRMVIKCADVSNPARPLPLCIEWAERIAEEYFQQTDEERALNLTVVMPNFDRATCSIPHSQLCFIEVFLLNMFEHWDAFLDIPDVAGLLQTNYKYWRELDEKQRLEESNTAPS